MSTKKKVFISLFVAILLLASTCLSAMAAHNWRFDSYVDFANMRFRGYAATSISNQSIIQTITVGTRMDRIDESDDYVFYPAAQLHAQVSAKFDGETVFDDYATSPANINRFIPVGEALYFTTSNYRSEQLTELSFSYWAKYSIDNVNFYEIWTKNETLSADEVIAAGNTGTTFR